MDEKFMLLAIEEAKKSAEPLKCGVVIVKEGKVLAQAHNSQRESHNASAHAEINAIKATGERLKSKDLDGCTIYCTCEPCIMCLSAIAFAKISNIVYGTPLADASSKGKMIHIDIETFLESAPYRIEVVKNFMRKECDTLL